MSMRLTANLLNSEFEYFFFKFEDPIYLYLAEQHILSEPNMEVSSSGHVSICKLPREQFSLYRGKETMQLLMMTYCQDIITNFKICTNVLVNHLTTIAILNSQLF